MLLRNLLHKSILKWHRYLGVVIALTVVIVAVTGILLNHTNAFGLDSYSVSNKWLLRAYGAEAPQRWAGFKLDEHTWVLQIDDQLLVNEAPLVEAQSSLVGAVYRDEFYLVATQGQVFLFDQAKGLVEAMSALHGIDDAISKIGLDEAGRVWLETVGHQYLVADEMISYWSPAAQSVVAWSSREQIPAELLESLGGYWFGGGVSLERLILDLHSGRVFRQAGVLLLDLAGVGMILLAFTGVWMWFRRISRQRR